MSRIYFDHAASTPVDPRVLRAMEPYFLEQYGNPGSLHSFGQEAIAAVDASREAIGKLIGAKFREVIFTGSATEANNLALRGALRRYRKDSRAATNQTAGNAAGHIAAHASANALPQKIIISSIEHESILETAEALGAEKIEIVRLPVNKEGIIDLEFLKNSLDERTILVSIMYVNNETGAIQPIKEAGRIISDFKSEKKSQYPLFHTDAVQAFQFLDCNADALGVDMMTFSAHKIYGPKGIGALYARQQGKDGDASRFVIAPIITGGGQEFGVRSGTENVPLIVGFAEAAKLAAEMREKESARVTQLSVDFLKDIQTIDPSIELNGPKVAARIPNILNIYFPGHPTQDLLTRFDRAGLAASSGSACRSRAVESSYVIEAMGRSKERARCSVRFSFGRGTNKVETARALEIIKNSLR